MEEFIAAWREADAVYQDLVTAAWWPREIRTWEARRREHERERRETPPTQEAFEAAAKRWRGEVAGLRDELARLYASTPEQRARSLDPWSKVHGSGPRWGPPGGDGEHGSASIWRGWRERLWHSAVQADLDLPRPLLPAELDEAERQLGVRLPPDYRTFLLEVASGISSGLPAPNLAPLVRDTAGRWRWDGIGTRTRLSRLDEEFPAKEVERLPDDEPRRADFASTQAYLAELTAWENEEPPYDGDPLGDLTRGALCLHSLGCGDALWLVVSGPRTGQLWADFLEHEAGLYPLRAGRSAPLSFRSWFTDAHGAASP